MAKATTTTAKKEEAVKELQIVPSVEYAGANTNFADQIFKAQDPSTLPVVTSIGCMQVPGSKYFISYTMFTQGNQIIKIEVDEPNMRAIAEDSAKANFVQQFCSRDIE